VFLFLVCVLGFLPVLRYCFFKLLAFYCF